MHMISVYIENDKSIFEIISSATSDTEDLMQIEIKLYEKIRIQRKTSEAGIMVQ